jgi:serine/threonine-protein phosphatase Stp1
MRTRAEVIGAGALAYGDLPGAHLEHPTPFPRGEAMGQHLTVQRLVRVTRDRQYYLVDNKSPKWPRRKCWACGYKYTPEMAKTCAYCATPLEDLQFLMSQRSKAPGFQPFEDFVTARIRHFGLITPVAAFYRGGSMLSVYHYNGESFLVDAPAPLAPSYVLAIGTRVANTLSWLHQRGVVLSDLRPEHVVIMPNGSVRLFDLDVAEVLDRPGAVWNHPDQPAARDVQRLGRLLGEVAGAEDEALLSFLRDATRGAYPSPADFADACDQLLEARQSAAPDPRATAHAAVLSDIGLVRAENEDSWGWRRIGDRAQLYAVADGLGGHAQGKLASTLAIEVLVEYMVRRANDLGRTPEENEKAMKAAIDVANKTVFEHRKATRTDMGTTLTAALVVDHKRVIIGHVGDTRVYLQSDGRLSRLTRDQTVAQDLLDDGMLTAEDAPFHRGASILTSTIGGEATIESQVLHHPVKPGDRLLLCTDGLYRSLGDDAISGTLTSWPDRHKTVRRLIRGALSASSSDNLTALVVDVP